LTKKKIIVVYYNIIYSIKVFLRIIYGIKVIVQFSYYPIYHFFLEDYRFIYGESKNDMLY